MSDNNPRPATGDEQSLLFDVVEFRPDRPEPEKPPTGVPRMKLPERQQVKFMAATWDDLLPEGHQARIVWQFVQGLDLTPLHSKIKAVEGRAGALLLEQGLVDMDRVAQDGMRVRASAGSSSFRRKTTLQECFEEAKSQVDGGYASKDDIERVSADPDDEDSNGTVVYAPVKKSKGMSRDPHKALPNDSPAVAAWRERMGTDEAKEIYKERASTAECVNAIARNRGLQQFTVRGLPKVRAAILWYVLAHNLIRAGALRASSENGS